MDETVFLEEPGANITSTKMVIDGKTFATRNIGSLSIKDTPLGAAPFLFAFAAIACFYGGAYVWGVLIGVASGYLFWSRAMERTLVIVAGGGETVAMKTRDNSKAERVHSAISRAIASR